jgi:pyruvate dehydrogenase E2 component (dihydrolipoyllysine-residue acetyltransferase)
VDPVGRSPHASPAVRRQARELGVDLSRVPGTGRGGRILRDDVNRWVRSAMSGFAPERAVVETDAGRFGPVERRPLGRIRKLSAKHLQQSWARVPLVTQIEEADITDLDAYRHAQADIARDRGVKLTLLPFVLKAVAAALVAFPDFNASLDADGETLILKRYVHVGVAVDTPQGLVVPVIRDVDKKGVWDIARELVETSERARTGKLGLDAFSGGCFSVSSLGGIGGTAFTPLVNPPEVAVLGVSRATTRPVWRDGAFAPRLVLPLCLSYDHRVIDGAAGARFIVHISKLLSGVQELIR